MERDRGFSFFVAPIAMMSMFAILVPVIISLEPIGQMRHFADPENIITWSSAISHGTPYWDFRDPPLRYLPISALIALLEPIHIEPAAVVLVYTVAMEFVIPLVVCWTIVVRWYDEAVATTAIVAVSFAYHLVPPVTPATVTLSGYWMYAYTLPAFLGVLYLSSAERVSAIYTGLLLGCLGLLQLAIAGVSAGIVAIVFLLRGDLKLLIRTAAVAIVTWTPIAPVVVAHRPYYASRSVLTEIQLGYVSVSSAAFVEQTAWFVSVGVVMATVWLCTRRYEWAAEIVKGTPTPLVVAVLVLLPAWYASILVFKLRWFEELFGFLLSYPLLLLFGIVLGRGLQTATWVPFNRGYLKALRIVR